jgi:hypothetical protein
MPSGFFFRVHGTEDSLIDSLGLFTLGLPDIQYHFHTLDPNDVSWHAFNAAAYSFEADVPVSATARRSPACWTGRWRRTCIGLAGSKWRWCPDSAD